MHGSQMRCTLPGAVGEKPRGDVDAHPGAEACLTHCLYVVAPNNLHVRLG